MTVKIRPTEQAVLTTLAAELNDINGTGIQVQPSTPIAATVYPIAGYLAAVPPGSPTETNVKNGNLGLLAPLWRRLGPITGAVDIAVPNFNFTTNTTLLSFTLPENQEIARNVQVTFNGSGFMSIANTRLDYWVDVNGVQGTTQRYYFNEAGVARSFGATWIVALPIGTPITISIRAGIGTGTGHMQFDSNCQLNMTFWG